MKTLTTQVTQIVQPYTLHPVTDDSTFEELHLTDVERDSIALDIENTLGIHVCDKTARGWQSVGDVVRAMNARMGEVA
ncbi:hypothetical protein [Novosphingobium sp. RL4]|uniref:hypothetical protein n=1 Tax=Novosphingobium sp. RL4 TaxID=3109595 RepID=UPI002D78E5DD|nr:hypothetical protein [Novosphingobium sp. RL4]WRT91872.1 hypothetical protein U9J33_11685 [Novosphingobium sp. RL4]